MTVPAAQGASAATGDGAVDAVNARVVELLKMFARAVRAHQLYLPNNPMHARALEALREAFSGVWAHVDDLRLLVTEDAFLHDDVVVFAETGRGGESLPWLFHKDGIRSFEMQREFEGDDLVKFLDAIRTARNRGLGDEDLVTLFWECDFAHFAYEYIEAGGDGDGDDAPGAELLQSGGGAKLTALGADPRSEMDADGDEHVADPSAADASPFARMSDFDSTLYFLDEREIRYLQDSIHEDFNRDLRPSVVAALLDTFESETDLNVREEICGILESLLITLLSGADLATTAYVMQEVSVTTGRAPSLRPQHAQRLATLADRMSDGEVLEQLFETLEHAPSHAYRDSLGALLPQLSGRALGPVITRMVQTHNVELRTLLDGAATRLAAFSTTELVQLIDSSDERVALEAVRRAGALRTPAAVPSLTRVLDSTNIEMRRAAVTALAAIGSTSAMQALERCVEDEDRTVRISAVQAIGERTHRLALPRVERALKGAVLRDGTSPEKTAFFEAYVALAGDAAIPFLANVLAPRRFLARKEDAATRACAALALGRLGSPQALDALRQGAADKDIVVRTAAARALRGGT